MYRSTYLPVNMNRLNCAVYSAEKVFPKEKLEQAYAFVTGKSVEGVMWVDGNVTFISDTNINWTIPEIYLAHNALETAMENNFSFFMVKDDNDIPQLFVSKAFKGHRILVNAMTFQTILIGNRQLLNKAASMIDHSYSSLFCFNFFNTVAAIESGSSKFLSAVLVNKDTDEEYMAVNPLTAMYADAVDKYYADELEEMREIRVGNVNETKSFLRIDDTIKRKDLEYWPALPFDHVDWLIETYVKIREKKSNYIPLINDDNEPESFFSVNQRYLVDAASFECIVIKNKSVKELLTALAQKPHNSHDQLMLMWMLAKTE